MPASRDATCCRVLGSWSGQVPDIASCTRQAEWWRARMARTVIPHCSEPSLLGLSQFCPEEGCSRDILIEVPHMCKQQNDAQLLGKSLKKICDKC